MQVQSRKKHLWNTVLHLSPQGIFHSHVGIIFNSLAWLTVSIALLMGADSPNPKEKEREALRQWQTFIGNWHGVGQPRRMSNVDAWTEDCGWVWTFANQKVALEQKSANGKYLRSAKLFPGAKSRQFVLEAMSPTGDSLQYFGESAEDGKLILSAVKDQSDAPNRITIRMTAGGDRMIILYERKVGDDEFTRIAEV